jgi:hypothetical protein
VRYQNVLNALSTLCGPPPLFKTLMEALTPRLITIASSSRGGEEDPKLRAAYLHALLAATKRALVPLLYGLCTCSAA